MLLMVKLKSRSTNGLPKSLVEVVVVELQAHERSEKRHIDEVINSRRYCCILYGFCTHVGRGIPPHLLRDDRGTHCSTDSVVQGETTGNHKGIYISAQKISLKVIQSVFKKEA